MRYTYNNIGRFTINATFKLDDNHMRDIFHAIAAVHCADMVTLDPHWGRSGPQT
jgi:hypothetical protein